MTGPDILIAAAIFAVLVIGAWAYLMEGQTTRERDEEDPFY